MWVSAYTAEMVFMDTLTEWEWLKFSFVHFPPTFSHFGWSCTHPSSFLVVVVVVQIVINFVVFFPTILFVVDFSEINAKPLQFCYKVANDFQHNFIDMDFFFCVLSICVFCWCFYGEQDMKRILCCIQQRL